MNLYQGCLHSEAGCPRSRTLDKLLPVAYTDKMMLVQFISFIVPCKALVSSFQDSVAASEFISI